ncbi:MAG: hypothetical protein J6C52_14410 [Clostridia bacterium]|nr:hypothetical protein [Clostridia bacterium]
MVVFEKRMQILVLAAALLLTSCGSGEQNADPSESTVDTTVPEVTSPENAREAVPSTLPDNLDFNGETITILQRSEEPYIKEFNIAEETGDVVDDAVYNRNLQVEDRLNVKINTIERDGMNGKHTDFISTVRNEVFAGDSSYDVVSFYAWANPYLSMEGVYMNLYELEHLNLKNPWWHKSFIENTEVYGQLYAAAGDIVKSSVTCSYGVYYNMTKGADYLKDINVYDLVRSGKWTVDKLTELTRNVYQDLNGNTEKDTEDFYGWYIHGYSKHSYLAGLGAKLSKPDGNGGYEIDILNDHNLEIIEKTAQLSSEIGILFDLKEANYTGRMFKDNLTLFMYQHLRFSEGLREMEEDYAILPIPKLNEEQKTYNTLLEDAYSQIAVPITCQNPEMVGAFLELMGELGYKKVTPAFLDTALKGKYLRDTDSAEMVDIILSGVNYEFVRTHTYVLNNPL